MNAKLVVGAVSDPQEKEADRVADQVMRAGGGPGGAAIPGAPPAGPPATPPGAPTSPTTPAIQRACSTCEEDEKIQRACAACDEEQAGTAIRRKEDPGAHDEAPVIQAKGEGGGFDAPPSVAGSITSLRESGGARLSDDVRGFMEPRFQRDFSHVRIHTGGRAAEAASEVRARAFTTGRDIVFGEGQYQPSTPVGQRLLAHELTHVVQQSHAGGTPIVQRGGDEDVPDPPPLEWTMPETPGVAAPLAQIDILGYSETETQSVTFHYNNGATYSFFSYVHAEVPAGVPFLGTYETKGGTGVFRVKGDKSDFMMTVYPFETLAESQKCSRVFTWSTSCMPEKVKDEDKESTPEKDKSRLVWERYERINGAIQNTTEWIPLHVNYVAEGEKGAAPKGATEKPKGEAKKQEVDWGEDFNTKELPDWFAKLKEKVNKLLADAKAEDAKLDADKRATDLPERLLWGKSATIQGKLGFGEDAYTVVILKAASDPNPSNLLVHKQRIQTAIDQGKLDSVAAEVLAEIRAVVARKKQEAQTAQKGKELGKELEEEAKKKAKSQGIDVPLWMLSLRLQLEELLKNEKTMSDLRGEDGSRFPDKLSVETTRGALSLDIELNFKVWVLVDDKWRRGVVQPAATPKATARDFLGPVQDMAAELRKSGKDEPPKPDETKDKLPAYPARILPQTMRPDHITPPGAEHKFRMVVDYAAIWGADVGLASTISKLGTPHFEWEMYSFPDDIKTAAAGHADWASRREVLIKELAKVDVSSLLVGDAENPPKLGKPLATESGSDWEWEANIPAAPGDYFLRCMAWHRQPTSKKFDYSQPPSEAVLPFSVVKVEELARDVRADQDRKKDIRAQLDDPKANLDEETRKALEAELEEIKTRDESTVGDLNKSNLDETKDLLEQARSLQKFVLAPGPSSGRAQDPLPLRLAQAGEGKLIKLWMLLQTRYPGADIKNAIEQLVGNLEAQKKELEGLQTRHDRNVGQLKEGTATRVVATLVSENTGLTYPLILMVGEIEDKDVDPYESKYRVVDLTVDAQPDKDRRYTGSASSDEKEAIKSAMKAFADDQKHYGKGDLFYRVPAKGIDVQHLVCKADVWDYLEYIAMAIGLVALAAGVVVSGGTLGPVAAGIAYGIGISAGVLGAALAIRNIARRDANDTLALDAELALDVIDIVGAIVMLGGAAKMISSVGKGARVAEIASQASKSVKAGRLARIARFMTLERGLLIFDVAQTAGSGVFVVMKVFDDIEEIKKLGLPKAQEDAMIAEVVFEAVKTGAMIVATSGGTIGALSELAAKNRYKSFHDRGWKVDDGWTGDAPRSLQAAEAKQHETWLESLRPETREALKKDPIAAEAFRTMDPDLRKMLTKCSSPCIPAGMDKALRKKLTDWLKEKKIPLDHPGLGEYFAKRKGASDDKASLTKAIDDLQSGVTSADGLDAFLKREVGDKPAVKPDAPADKGAAPADKGAAPADKGAAPADKGAAPADKGAAPADKGAAPADKGAAPADKGAAPADKGAAASKAATPTSEGAKEAARLGRPPAEEGYHWRLQGGKLQYVAEPSETGQPPRKKKIWSEEKKAIIEDSGAKVAESFPDDASFTKQDAFDELGGDNPESPFGKWVVFMTEKLGFSRESLINGLQAPKGLRKDTVRHNLKKQQVYQDAIRKWLLDADELKKRYPEEWAGVKPDDAAGQAAATRKAQHRAVLAIDDHLPLKDATNWTERWYVELYGKVADAEGGTVKKVEVQVELDKDALNNAGIATTGTRVADAVISTEVVAGKPGAAPVETNVIKDVKSHEGKLGAHDEAQYADYKAMIGKDVPHLDRSKPGKGETTKTKINGIVEVFLDPKGGKANVDFIVKELHSQEGKDGKLSFEVFNSKGERKRFTAQEVEDHVTPAALKKAILAHCDS